MTTWYITGALAGSLFARADDGTLVRIQPGAEFLGIPFDKLKVGSYIEEQASGKGKVVRV